MPGHVGGGIQSEVIANYLTSCVMVVFEKKKKKSFAGFYSLPSNLCTVNMLFIVVCADLPLSLKLEATRLVNGAKSPLVCEIKHNLRSPPTIVGPATGSLDKGLQSHYITVS